MIFRFIHYCLLLSPQPAFIIDLSYSVTFSFSFLFTLIFYTNLNEFITPFSSLLFYNLILTSQIKNVKILVILLTRVSASARPIPTKPRSRSVPDVTDTKFAAPLLAKLLIKCQRLPRGFFWNSLVPLLVC